MRIIFRRNVQQEGKGCNKGGAVRDLLLLCHVLHWCNTEEMKSGFSEEFPTIIKGLNPLVVARFCLEGEIFDLRGENIANWGNLVEQRRRKGGEYCRNIEEQLRNTGEDILIFFHDTLSAGNIGEG